MKKKILILGFFLALVFGVLAWLYFAGETFSPAQKETVDLFGLPDQFVITYLPRGDGETLEMVRSEVWYYGSVGQEISFLAGELVSVDEFESEIESSGLSPADFDLYDGLSSIEIGLGTEAITQLGGVPGFDEEDLQTYLAPNAIFILEQGYLTYFQTLTQGERPDLLPTPEPTLSPTDGSSKKSVNNEVHGFTFSIPQDWFFDSTSPVLTNYDPGYLAQGIGAPDMGVKCDFVSPFEGVSFDYLGELTRSEELIVERQLITDYENEDSLGFGDGVVYQIQSGEKETWLVCYWLDEEIAPVLEEALRTVRYE